MSFEVSLFEVFERIFSRICHILVLITCLKQSVCRPRDMICSPSFYEKCSNGYLFYRHLSFHIDFTLALDAMIFNG